MPSHALQSALASGQSRLDQRWASARDVLFDQGIGFTGDLMERLGRDDAPEWLAKQDWPVKLLVCELAGLAAGRIGCELIAGVLDDGE